MFCPRCGGEQASGNMRFCSRCGFPLGGVLSLLASGGESNSTALQRPPGRSLYRRVVGLAGAKVLFASVVAVPISIVLAIIADSPGPFILPLLLFVLGLAHVAYAVIFGTILTSEVQDTHPVFDAPGTRYDLPPARGSYIAPEPIGRVDTARIKPPSVTESTTNLLDPEDVKKF